MLTIGDNDQVVRCVPIASKKPDWLVYLSARVFGDPNSSPLEHRSGYTSDTQQAPLYPTPRQRSSGWGHRLGDCFHQAGFVRNKKEPIC